MSIWKASGNVSFYSRKHLVSNNRFSGRHVGSVRHLFKKRSSLAALVYTTKQSTWFIEYSSTKLASN